MSCKSVLPDSCFWFGLFDSSDQHHFKSQKLINYIENHRIIMPYPILYETLNSRLLTNLGGMQQFEKILKSDKIDFVQDDKYKIEALETCIVKQNYTNRKLSFVDIVIRLLLQDINIHINYFITYDTGHFIDICQRRKIELINN